MVAVNHMNQDIAEVNGSDPPMLPGSFLYEKEPGYEATCACLQWSSTAGRQFDVTVETFTGSHHQTMCMLFLVKWTQFYLEEKRMHAISLFFVGSLYRGGQSRRFPCKERHQDHCFFFLSVGDPSYCPYMGQTDFKLYSLK